MVYEDMLSGVTFALIRFVASVVLAVASVYFGIRAFDKLTEGIKEIEELKRGNAAVGIVVAAVIIAIAAVVRTGVFEFTSGIQSYYSVPLILFLAVVNSVKLIFGLMVAVVTIFISFNLLDRITESIDEINELKKQNVAIAILIAGVLLAVSIVVDAGLESLINSPSLDGCAIAKNFSDSVVKIDVSGCALQTAGTTSGAPGTTAAPAS